MLAQHYHRSDHALAEGESVDRLPLEWDETPETILRKVKERGWRPRDDLLVEFVEVFDYETRDLLVMWRVPCHREPDKAVA